MNNKKLGTEWEREFCEILAKNGYWVHFITPDSRGAQPFDIVACINGNPFAFDCKTSAKPIFSINRLEMNQILAFEKWIKCGNNTPIIAVKYADKYYLLSYLELKEKQSIDLRGVYGCEL